MHTQSGLPCDLWHLQHCYRRVSSSAICAKGEVAAPLRILERGIALERDAVTGEVRTRAVGDSRIRFARHGAVPIRSRRRSCAGRVHRYHAPDGSSVRGLSKESFRLFENGKEQRIASFDAASAGASIVLLLDDSPSVYRELGEEREAACNSADAIAAARRRSCRDRFRGSDESAAAIYEVDRKLLAAALASPELCAGSPTHPSRSFIRRRSSRRMSFWPAAQAGRRSSW